MYIFYSLVFFFVGYVEILELIGSLGICYYSDIVSQLLLLEELLGVVLEGSLGERNLGGYLDLVCSGIAVQSDDGSNTAGLAIDFNSISQKLFLNKKISATFAHIKDAKSSLTNCMRSGLNFKDVQMRRCLEFHRRRVRST